MRENIGGRKGTYNPELAKGTRLRFARWREGAIRYIKEKGPTCDHDLMNEVRQVNGRRFTKLPASPNSINNLLNRDNRFVKQSHTHATGMTKYGAVWGLSDE